MTGRRLYDYFCDAHEEHVRNAVSWDHMELSGRTTADRRLAWPALSLAERRLWNAMARRIKAARR